MSANGNDYFALADTVGVATGTAPIGLPPRAESRNSLEQSVPPSPTLQSPAMRRNLSDGNLMAQEVKEARVRVIYTGGTIGMMRNERNGKQGLAQSALILASFSHSLSLLCSTCSHTELPGATHTQISEYT